MRLPPHASHCGNAFSFASVLEKLDLEDGKIIGRVGNAIIMTIMFKYAGHSERLVNWIEIAMEQTRK